MQFYELTLYFTSIQCNDETTGTNWGGSDEINILGVGVAEYGVFFPVPYKDLGNWDAGVRKVNPGGPENVNWQIVKVLLPSNSLRVSVGLFMTENDRNEPLRSKVDDLLAFTQREVPKFSAEHEFGAENGWLGSFGYLMETSIRDQVKTWADGDEEVLGHFTLNYRHPQYIDRQTSVVPREDHRHEEENYFHVGAEYRVNTRWYLNPVPVEIDIPVHKAHTFHAIPPVRNDD